MEYEKGGRGVVGPLQLEYRGSIEGEKITITAMTAKIAKIEKARRK